MALLAVQQIQTPGTAPTYAAATGGGDTVPSDGRTFLHVKNGSGAPITVTVATPGNVGGLAIADNTVSVPNAGERMIGPITADLYGDIAAITYSGVTSLTIGAFRA